MRNWGASRKGGFQEAGAPRPDPGISTITSLVYAGSNSGANAHFYVRQVLDHRFSTMRIGTQDISDLCRDSLDRYQRYDNRGWRVEARGTMPCATGASIGTRSVDVEWHIGPWRQAFRS